MTRITLGKTGLQVSPLYIGTWQLAGPVTFDGEPDGHPDPGKANVLRMIRELKDRRLNFIDTAATTSRMKISAPTKPSPTSSQKV